VVMQRIHAMDFSGYLLDGGSEENWHHLWLPIEIDQNAHYPDEFVYGIPIEHTIPNGPLWSRKHNKKQIETLKLLGEVYDCQYAQRPNKEGGNLFKTDWFSRYKDIPALQWRSIYVDTAQKTKEHNDYTVLQCWGKTKQTGKAILLDLVRGRFEAPELEKVVVEFWRKHLRMMRPEVAPLRKMMVEDKVSGTGLIQALRKGPSAIPVIPVERNRDKYTRALDCLPHCAAGNVMLPIPDHEFCPWLPDFEKELRDFDGLDGSAFDDQVDAMMDAIFDILGSGRDIIISTASGAH
jgi:predicted phage terminase large subunit-like protein